MNILQQYQFQCHLATDGQEAFEFVKIRFEETGTTYDLIIMDIYMPICDGVASSEMIRSYLQMRINDGHTNSLQQQQQQ